MGRRKGIAVLWAALLGAFALVSAPAAAQGAPGRVVAVGDLHGDFVAWRAIAQAAGLVDARGRWSGGRATLVQLGDMVDRGPDSLRVVQDMMRLQREARGAGGRVVALVGNHEAMNMTDDLRYVSAADFAAYATPDSPRLRERAWAAYRERIEASYRRRDPAMTAEAIRAAWLAATPLGWLEHQAAWRPDGAVGGWITAQPAIAQIDGTLFVHGGLSAAYATLPVAEINARVARALRAQETAPNTILTDPQGPLWYRGLAQRDPAEPNPVSVEDELAQVLAGHQARRIVIAHTPILSGVAILNEGRLARVDTGISSVYGGVLGWLEIAGDQLTARSTPRPPASGAR